MNEKKLTLAELLSIEVAHLTEEELFDADQIADKLGSCGNRCLGTVRPN